MNTNERTGGQATSATRRRIRSRIGGRGAITATAHKLARLVYRMLKFGAEYVAQSLSEYESLVREKLECSVRRKALALHQH